MMTLWRVSCFVGAFSRSMVIEAESREEALYVMMQSYPRWKHALWEVEPVQGPTRTNKENNRE